MPDDGLLAYDANGNGMIEDANELFGYGTWRSIGEVADWQSGVGIVLPDGSLRGFNDYELQSFTSGYKKLALFDANNDGIISAADGAAFTGLTVWRDLNQDGRSEADELFSLAQGATYNSLQLLY